MGDFDLLEFAPLNNSKSRFQNYYLLIPGMSLIFSSLCFIHVSFFVGN